MMHPLKLNESLREKLERFLVFYIGVILWIYQPRISAGANCGRPGRTVSSIYAPSGTEFNENAVIHYTCDREDHVILGVSERRCQRNGTWSGEIPVCSKMAKIEKAEHAGDVDIGLVKSFDMNISTCTEPPPYGETTWIGYLKTSANITAVRITILGKDELNMDVTVQEDGVNEKKCTTKKAGSEITDKSTKSVTFHCPAGTIGNTIQIKCSYQAFSICEVSALLPPVSRCLTPDTPLHGIGHLKVSGDETEYVFRCNPGYKLWGDVVVRCQTDGTWSPHRSPICNEIYCFGPDNPENGYVEYDFPTRGRVPYNGTARYSCNEGYYLDGYSTLTCVRWDDWDYPPPKCNPKTPDTSTVVHNTVLIESRMETNAETCGIFKIDGESQGEWISVNGSGSFLVLICPGGFHIEGSPAVTRCLSNGSWSYSSAECKKSFGSPWGSTWTPSLMLIVAVAAGAGTAIFILCLSAFLVIKKRRQTRTNTSVFHLENGHYDNTVAEMNIRRQRHHSATESYESIIERRSTSACTNPRKPRSALPNLPLDADPVYAQPFETAATKKLSSASQSRKEDLYNTHIYAEPVDSRKTPFNIPVNVSSPRIGTDSRESVVKTNIGNEPPLSVSIEVQNCVKKCAIYDSSTSAVRNSGNLRTDEKRHKYSESSELGTLTKNIEYLELI